MSTDGKVPWLPCACRPNRKSLDEDCFCGAGWTAAGTGGGTGNRGGAGGGQVMPRAGTDDRLRQRAQAAHRRAEQRQLPPEHLPHRQGRAVAAVRRRPDRPASSVSIETDHVCSCATNAEALKSRPAGKRISPPRSRATSARTASGEGQSGGACQDNVNASS